MVIQPFKDFVRRVGGKIPLHVFFVLLFVPQIFGTGALIGYLSYKNGQKAVNDLADRLLEKASEEIKLHLENHLATPLMLVKSNAYNVQIGAISFDRPQQLEQYLWGQLKLYSGIESTYFGNNKGQFIEVLKDRKKNFFVNSVRQSPDNTTYLLNDKGERIRTDGKKDYDPRKRPWYQEADLERRVQWNAIYPFSEGTLGMTASAPFYDAKGNFLGALGIDFTLRGLSQFLKELKVSDRSQIFILEPSGKLVATSAEVQIVKFKPNLKQKEPEAAIQIKAPLTKAIADSLKNPETGAIEPARNQPRFLFNHQFYYVRVLPYKDDYGLNWLIVVVVPENDLMERVNANGRLTIALCLVALAVATGVGILTARWLMTPLARFVEATDLLAHGKLDRMMEEGYIREIKILARSFNRMICQLQAAFFKLEMANLELEERVQERTKALEGEREKSERLLLNILPEPIAQRLKHDQSAIAEHFDDVTLLFADIVGFTPLSARLKPIELVNLLNDMFSSFDALADYYKLEKIKTIGDAYMVAGGLPVPQADSAAAIAEMALDMLAAVHSFNLQRHENFQVRIGLNAGDVVAGVIGTKKFIYDVWGDTVNVASRMESSGYPGKIQVTAAVRERLQDRFIFEERGAIEVKGKGLMTTYWLRDRIMPLSAENNPLSLLKTG